MNLPACQDTRGRSGHPVVRCWRHAGRAPAGPPRIVSLVPSLTELVCDFGLARFLVGCTAYCVHPRGLTATVARVGGTKTPKLERIRAMAPTHLLVNVDENERATVETLAREVPEVIVTHPIEIEDHFELFDTFGAIFDRGRQARHFSALLADALARSELERLEPIDIAYLIWKDPWMTVGPDTFIARMLSRAGLVNLRPDPQAAAERYPVCSVDELARSAPQAVLLSSEPCRFRPADRLRLRASLDGGSRRPPPMILGIDGEMCSWYGTRVILGLDYLRAFRGRLERRLARRRSLRGDS